MRGSEVPLTVRPALRVILAVLLLGQLFQAAVSATPPGPLAGHPAPASVTVERGIDLSLSTPQKSNPLDGAAFFAHHCTLLPRNHALAAPCSELKPYKLPGFSPLALHLIYRQQTSADL